MKNTIIFTIILVALMMGAKAQTVDTAFTSLKGFKNVKILTIKPDYFSPDSAAYLGVIQTRTNQYNYIGFDWVVFSSTGVPIKNGTELINTHPEFENLSIAIHNANSLLPIFTWIATRYSLVFR